jgi:ferritin-like metal-binding protein YciE
MKVHKDPFRRRQMMEPQNKKLLKLLVEAHTNELALVTTLQAHLKMTEHSGYRRLLQRHLEETKDHADRIARRLDELGNLHSPFSVAYDIVQNVAKQAMVLGKGPMDALRGGRDTEEKMVRNAMDEAMTEGLEIASYDAIESFARALGDSETATLAADIRADEERMLEDLRNLIPELSKNFAENSTIDLDERAAV